MLKIGNLSLNSNLFLAPMAGISDLPFRMMNRKFGCSFAFVEMINCRSISHRSKKTRQMLLSNQDDSPLGVQLLGCEEKFIYKAIDTLKSYKFDILDFNAACPAKKVVRRGEGASLLNDPKKLFSLLKMIVKEAAITVTVKIRTGWNNSVYAKDIAKLAQDAGVSAVFIHGRTKEQGYSGKVDYRTIKEIKEVLRIPVIASGDIFSPFFAKKMFDETGCDGIVIARGALGNPWIFKETQEFLSSGRFIDRPGIREIAGAMIEHLKMCVDFYGEKNGVIVFRKFFNWYTRGFQKVRPFREEANRVITQDSMLLIIQKCRDFQKQNNCV